MPHVLGLPHGERNPISDVLTPQKSEAHLQCEADGGRWDEATNTCIFPTPKPIQTKPPQEIPKPELPEVLTTADGAGDPEVTGRPTGVTLPDGRTFLGLNREDIENVKAIEERRRRLLEGTQPAGTARAQQAIEQERQRIIAEETPQRRQLDPTEGSFFERIPGIGGLVSVSRTVIGEPVKKALGIKTTQGLELTPDQLRTAGLTEIERQEIERGLTANEAFGAFIEAIPLGGNQAAKYAGGLIETPSENAREVKSNILKEKRRISNIETNVKLGYLPVPVAEEQLNDIESNVQRLESRIRLLINNSPELRFNSDYVNTVETDILATREKVFQAKQNILTGATKDPSEIEILMRLKELSDEGEVEI